MDCLIALMSSSVGIIVAVLQNKTSDELAGGDHSSRHPAQAPQTPLVTGRRSTRLFLCYLHDTHLGYCQRALLYHKPPPHANFAPGASRVWDMFWFELERPVEAPAGTDTTHR